MAAARSAEEDASRKNLSKNVLQMKFMQKGVVVRLDEKEEMEKRIKRSKEHWVIGGLANQPKELPYQFDTSTVVCEDLLPIGRMSFKDFNPVVDKTHRQLLRQARKRATRGDAYDDDVEEISDDEMAGRFESLVQTIEDKFQQGKRKGEQSGSDSESDEELQSLKKRAKRGFLKPSY